MQAFPSGSILRGVFMRLFVSQLRLLIFIVAYNAEKTIQSVLSRIPESLANQ
jgi:hypothetical protein